MKAVRIHQFGATENLRVDEIETPEPKAGEVLIKTKVAGINYADIMLREGKYFFRPPLPFVPGFEVAGTVEAIGDGVENLQTGQRVLAMMSGGAYAEYAIAPAARTFPVPDDLEFGAATALLVQGLTALGLLEDFRAGQSILIHAAAGGVGSLLVQLAKGRGGRVLGTASSPEKLEKVAGLGADAGINYSEPDWTKQVLEATGGKGADLIIEMVGGEVGKRNFECLATKGTMIIYGAASGEDFQISAVGLMSKMHVVKGYNLNFETPENIARFSRELMQSFTSGNLKVSVTEFQLEQAAEAHRAVEGRKTTGKVVLTV